MATRIRAAPLMITGGDHTKEDTRNHSVGVQSLSKEDIAQRDPVQFGGITTPSGVDDEKYRPSQTATNHADEHNHAKIP
jgi:hypothetical protein